MIKSESFSESDRVEDAELTDNESDSSEEINIEDTAVNSKDEILDRNDVIRDVIEITETDKMIFYRYPLSEETTDRSAELSFYYKLKMS